MPWMALVPLISGVCSVFGTFEMTSKPTKAARTRIASSVRRSIRSTFPSRATQAPRMTSSSKSRASAPSSPLISSSSDSTLRA